jgi:D-3-phosphoglycerate dehydrogenase
MKDRERSFRVVITGDTIAPEALRLLSEKCQTDFTGAYPKPDELARKLTENQADGLILRTGKISEEGIKASPRLKVIAKHGVGVDNVDVKAASKLKIPVLVTSSANFQSVAEHTLGLMLCLAKDFPRLDSRMHQGFWDKTAYRGVELFQKTLGLIGFGRVGRRVRELVVPLQMKIIVYDPFISDDEIPSGVTRVGQLDPLLKTADIVSLHCPLTELTRHMIGEKELGMMKKTSWLINTARGEVVEEGALIHALQEGKIAAAGLETFSKEPPPPEALSLLSKAGKVVLTPHVAASTEESIIRMGVEAARNVLTILEGKKPDKRSLVNPEIYEEK